MKIQMTLQHNKFRHTVEYCWPLQRCPINVSEVNKHFSLSRDPQISKNASATSKL